jgi:putative PIN family toxin of toxin-antitoxin system
VRRVTRDSNIIISALSCGGKPQELLDLARHGGIELAVSDAILDEVGRILSDKFVWIAERVNNLRAEIATFTKRVAPTETLDVLKDDASDNRIVECAVPARIRCHCLQVTSTCSRSGAFGGSEVMTVSDFLQQGLGR